MKFLIWTSLLHNHRNVVNVGGQLQLQPAKVQEGVQAEWGVTLQEETI